MTTVRHDEQYYDDLKHVYRDRIVSMAKDVCRQSAGLPIGVQLVGWPHDDERVLSVMKELEETIDKKQLPVPELAKNIDIFTNENHKQIHVLIDSSVASNNLVQERSSCSHR
jgi:hypothetical protein